MTITPSPPPSSAREAVFRAVLRYPPSIRHKLVLADACLDDGDELEAEFWRWMAAKKKRPDKDDDHAWYANEKHSWSWRRENGTRGARHYRLPMVFGQIPDDIHTEWNTDMGDHNFPLVFFSPGKAWTALVKRWKALTDEQRAGCWAS